MHLQPTVDTRAEDKIQDRLASNQLGVQSSNLRLRSQPYQIIHVLGD